MPSMKLKILSWNVRVNDVNKRKLIKALIRSQRVDLVCLQETKIQDLFFGVVRSLGVGRFLEWGVVNARGATRGVVVFWDNRVLEFVGMEVGQFSVSCCFKNFDDGFVWIFIGVYRIVLSSQRVDWCVYRRLKCNICFLGRCVA